MVISKETTFLQKLKPRLNSGKIAAITLVEFFNSRYNYTQKSP